MPNFELRFIVAAQDDPAIRQLAEALSEAFRLAKAVNTHKHVRESTIIRYLIVREDDAD